MSELVVSELVVSELVVRELVVIPSWSDVVVSAALTVTLTTVALAGARVLLTRLGMYDRPNPRSSHTVRTLRGGGIGILTGLAASLAILSFTSVIPSPLDLAVPLLVSALLFGAIGWLDDRRSLGAWPRLAGQTGLAVAVTALLWSRGEPTPVVWVATAVGLVFYVNAANFMDGVNGISASHGLVVGCSYVLLGTAYGDAPVAITAIVVAAAFASFLPWNARRPTMFMGDSGSYALGASVAALAVSIYVRHGGFVAVIAPVAIYTSDVAVTLVRRMLRRVDLTEAHREHVYQRIQQATGSHAVSSLAANVATASCSVIGLLSVGGQVPVVPGAMALGLIVSCYLLTPSLLELRLHDARSGDLRRPNA